VEIIEYKGWKNCCRLTNGKLELVVTADVGPRIIRFGFVDGENEFLTGGNEWRIYGGHRLWCAPEENPRSYAPDNESIQIKDFGDFVRLSQPTEVLTGIEKQIDIYLDKKAAEVKVVHRLINRNIWAIELAVWALSVMAPGGKAIIPFSQRGSHASGDLLPSDSITLWSYTSMADPRWTWGSKYIMLQSQPGNQVAQKVGAMVSAGWAAYALNDHLFVKHFDYTPEFAYADYGCNVESFTNEAMLELETLGPLTWLKPGESAEHVETWNLYKNVPMPATEADVDQYILPLVNEE